MLIKKGETKVSETTCMSVHLWLGCSLSCVKLSQYLLQLLNSVVFCLKDLQNFPVLVLSFLLFSSTAQIEQKSKIKGAGCHSNRIQSTEEGEPIHWPQ